MALPRSARYVVVGAGIHGLATAWRLAARLRASGRGDGRDVLVLDKTGVGAGASGIACGVVRNNYFQPAMRELMAHSVSVWESDPEAFAYHGVGYLQAAPAVMEDGVRRIHAEQQAIGYPSVLVEGVADCDRYLRGLFPDWQARGITTVLHEQRGGYANNQASLRGLADKARAEGVAVHDRVRVMGLRTDGAAVTTVETDRGDIDCDWVVVAAGPWVRDFWKMMDLPDTVAVRDRDGLTHRPMWTYWALQEGVLKVDPGTLTGDDGRLPPVVHVDSDAPLYDDADGSLVTDRLWGIYYKPDFVFDGVQGGAVPHVVERDPDDVAVDPYGPASPDFVVGADFARLWTSALAHCHKRFEGRGHLFSGEPSGGLGCFTPDSFPIFDVFGDNAYFIADSNHGYKMVGVGDLVAKELLGSRQPLLEPFRFSRYASGQLHPRSSSPFPWS